MPDADYRAVVQETFITKPLRTVLMIDDQFPSFSDLATPGSKAAETYAQTELAKALYDGFHKRHMLCDIVNHVGDVDQQIEHLRKSDLIILDYHLENDSNEKALKVLRKLSSTPHFNTIVVYTTEPKLDDVWIDVIASLTGGWAKFPAELQHAAGEAWTKLMEEEKLPQATKQAAMEFARRRTLKDIDGSRLNAAKKELRDLGVDADATEGVFTAMLHEFLGARAGGFAREPLRAQTVGGYKEGIRWIQSHNCFVAIIQKANLPAQDASINALDPTGLIAGLEKALIAWQPNLIQVLVSEIQNTLEHDALLSEGGLLHEAETQTALWYYLLQSTGVQDFIAPPNLEAHFMELIKKLVEGIKGKLSSDAGLLEIGQRTMVSETKVLGWTKDNWPSMGSAAEFEGAVKLTRAEGIIEKEGVLFRLNSFLSSEPFQRYHLTTGVLFTNEANNTYWVVASPACDLTVRDRGSTQKWINSIDPTLPMVAVQIELVEEADQKKAALKSATSMEHIFIETAEERRTFKLHKQNSPSYELFFVRDRGTVTVEGGKTIFYASRFSASAGAPQGSLVAERFEVMDRMMRGLYATRLLQTLGQHLSRVGLDFVRLP
jgi:CheY-like chemotaxis protein